MLQLTKRTEYGLIALVHLADRPGEFVPAREVSESYPVPRRLVAEVLKELCRAGLIESQRGSSGGYALARHPKDVSLAEVVSVLEGPPSMTECESLGAFRGGSCEVTPVCPIRSPFQRIRVGLWSLLQSMSLEDLSHAPAGARFAGVPVRTGAKRQS